MTEDREALVYFAEHPDSQIVQGLEDALASYARAGTGRGDVLFGLLVDLGARLASIAAIRTPVVASQNLRFTFRTGSLTHAEDAYPNSHWTSSSRCKDSMSAKCIAVALPTRLHALWRSTGVPVPCTDDSPCT